VLLVHLLGVWGLLQVESVREAAREVAPLFIDLIVPAPPPAPPSPPEPVRMKRPPPPLVTAAPSPTPSTSSFVAEAPPPEPVAAAPVETPPAPAPAAPAILRVSAGALQYLAQPPVEVPRLSRRLGESGTVLVRVVVDVNGLPRVVALHKSSGFSRLDEQALGAMRAARFKPCTRDGAPIDCEAIAPIAYELEN
jgi:protein TonB